MSRPYLADLPAARARRIAAVVALAAAGGSFGLTAQAEASVLSAETDPNCQVLLALAEGDDPCLVPEDEGEDSSYRVCHSTGDPAHPWEEMTFESGGDQNRWLEEHPDDYDPEKKPHPEYGEECPPDPEPEQPTEEEPPPVVVKEQPQPQPQVQQQPQAQQAAAPQAQSAPSLNVARSCASRRNFRIRVRTRKADPVVRAIVRVNGKKVRVVRGKRLTAPVRLTGLPKGRYSVTITAHTREGRKLSGVRRYFTCTPKSARRTVPQL